MIINDTYVNQGCLYWSEMLTLIKDADIYNICVYYTSTLGLEEERLGPLLHINTLEDMLQS